RPVVLGSPSGFWRGWGMTGVETIARIRFEHFQNCKGIKRIARELGVARDTVRKVLRSGATEFSYKREVQPQRKLGFDPGEAYQFDWSHEGIELQSLPLTVKLAQMRLSYSRMPIVRAYPRET